MAVHVVMGEQSFALEPGETVLDGLLRSGVDVPHACKAGACQACRLQSVSGETFLACQTRPDEDLAVRTPDDFVDATIDSLSLLSPSVLEVRLRTPKEFQFHAGQFVTVIRTEDGLARSYSIANCPSPSHEITLHVRRVAGGQMSSWLFDHAAPGQPVRVRGPAGRCFYVPPTEREPQPLLLAGTGTGLAPLYGILKDALTYGHAAPIHLFHGVRNQDGWYLRDELSGLSHVFPRLQYVPVLTDGSLWDSIEGMLPEDLSGWRAYLCGNPAAVEELQEQVFLAGVASSDIFADAFVPASR